MTEHTEITPEALVAHYRTIAAERMRGLPIVNPRIDVEAVGFCDFDGHRFGVLIAPWFMNMVLLPGSDDWAALAQGDKVTLALPAGEYEFTVCRDDCLAASYLSAVLFRTMTDFPGQSTARAVALEIVARLLDPPDEEGAHGSDTTTTPGYSRRQLLSGAGRA